ncbi:kelch repeat protein [Ancylostoma caninum]|uniref:Kelch repeat protein n=1 Tax=Ancylostoma caninum TaxID=29170 RepID=A0A368G3B4_ANCCA|nr:kelch repeat protein [Ancylostoma caninum]
MGSAATKVERFIEKHFILIAQTESFLDLSIQEIVELLSKDWLHVESEEQVFFAAMRWIEHSPERNQLVDRVLSCVRLHLLEKTFLMKEVFHNQIIRNHKHFCDLIERVLKYHLAPELLPMSRSTLSRPRCSPYFPILVMGGNSDKACLSDVENYDSAFQLWKCVQPMGVPRSYFGIAVDGDRVYVAGGRDDCYNTLNSVECYNATRNEWTEVARLKEKRFAPVAAFLRGKLYVCGGYHDRPLNTVEVYDPENDSWEDGVPMNVSRRGACVAVLGGYIYVMGGSDESSRTLSSVERFSPKKPRWEVMPVMSKSRFGAGAAVVNGMIYVCGGFNYEECYLCDVECFNPETMRWLAVDPMPVKRETAAVLSLNNAIYVIGGFDGSDRCRQILVFNTDTNTWELGGTLSYPRSCLGAAVIPMSGPRRKIISIPRRHKRKSEEKMETANGKIELALVHVRSKFPLPENE